MLGISFRITSPCISSDWYDLYTSLLTLYFCNTFDQSGWKRNDIALPNLIPTAAASKELERKKRWVATVNFLAVDRFYSFADKDYTTNNRAWCLQTPM